MPTKVVHGRYTDETVILKLLRDFFPTKPVRALFDRSRWYCTTPVAMTDQQLEALIEAIRQDHYVQDSSIA